MKRRKHASSICDDFENDNVRRTKRANRRRKVRFHRSTCAVCPAKYLLALFLAVGVRARLLAAALGAVAAQVTLAAVGGRPVTHDVPALAVLTS
jgi:hypothetical protein